MCCACAPMHPCCVLLLVERPVLCGVESSTVTFLPVCFYSSAVLLSSACLQVSELVRWG